MEKGTKRETSCLENKNRNIDVKYMGGMHKQSQTISKMKPKIRIIHIFAPQIIHTDAHNFRQLVQTLTGKPTASQKSTKITKHATHTSQESTRLGSNTNDSNNGCGLRDQTVKMEVTDGFLGLDLHNRSTERLVIKEEEGFYFRGLEGFISEFGNFPYFPNWDASHHSHAQHFEDTLFT